MEVVSRMIHVNDNNSRMRVIIAKVRPTLRGFSPLSRHSALATTRRARAQLFLVW